jgi:hypothetical protein
MLIDDAIGIGDVVADITGHSYQLSNFHGVIQTLQFFLRTTTNTRMIKSYYSHTELVAV